MVEKKLKNLAEDLYEENSGTVHKGRRKGSKWSGEKGRELAIRKIRDFLDNKLEIPMEDIPKVVSAELLYDKGGLSGPIVTVFNGSTYNAIQAAYQNIFKPWEFRNKPKGIWKGGNGYKNAAEATRWLIEEKLKMPVKKASEKLTLNTFREYRLSGMLYSLFEGKPHKALINAYPGIFTIGDFEHKESGKERGTEHPKISESEMTEILKIFEPYIKYRALKYYSPSFMLDFDDLVQVGRAGVWEAVKKYGITKKNVEKNKRRVFSNIMRVMGNNIHNSYDKVLDFATSLDAYVFEESKKRSLEEVVQARKMEEGEYEVRAPSPKSKKQSFYRILKSTLSEKEYNELRNDITSTLNKLECKYMFDNIDWDPLEEGTYLIRKIPRFKNVKKWEILKHKHIWEGSRGHELAREATRYLFEEKLNIPEGKIPEVSGVRVFRKNGLMGMLLRVYDGKPYLAVADAYPGKFKPWEFETMPHIWSGEHVMRYAAGAVRHMVEKKMGIKPQEALKKVRRKDFQEHTLGGNVLQKVFKNQPYYHAIINAYPALFPEYKINKVVEFVNENLRPLGRGMSHYSIIKEIDTSRRDWNPVQEGIKLLRRKDPSYENKNILEFKGSEWNEPIQAVRWLVEEKLKIPTEEIPDKIRENDFHRYGLGGMFCRLFGNSPYKAIENAYTERFESYRFRRNGMWKGQDGKNLAASAVRHMVEKEKIPFEEIPKITYDMFKKYKLAGMLGACFNNDLSEAIENAYPDTFNPLEFKGHRKWVGIDGSMHIKEAVRWLVEEKLKISPRESPEKITKITRYDFKKYGLGGLIQCFNYSPYKAINYAYPKKFKPWEFTTTQVWNGGNGYGLRMAKHAVRWLVEEKLKIQEEEVPSKIKKSTFEGYRLGGMLSICFDNSPYDAVNHAYPNKFKPWEFKSPNSYWQGDEGRNHATEATKWLIEEKLGIPTKKIPDVVTQNMFYGHNLSGMLTTVYDGSPYKAIEDAYPGRFKPWEFKITPNGIWTGEHAYGNAAEATRWLVEEKLQIPIEDIPQKIRKNSFIEHGLSGMLSNLFGDSPYRAIDNAYPGTFSPHNFRGKHKSEGQYFTQSVSKPQ